MGSEHTHKCVWNGNNTAIDGCYEPEGSCVRPPAPSTGTIMSYCPRDFAKGFGSQPGNVIRNFVKTAPCFVHSYLEGVNLFCETATYNLINIPPDAFLSGCSVLPSVAASVSHSGDTCTLVKSGSYNDEITLTAYLMTPCGILEVTKKAWIGIPKAAELEIHNSVNDEPYFCTSHGENYFKIHNSGGFGSPSDFFEIQFLSYPSLTLLYTKFSGSHVEWNYIPPPGWYIFKIRVINHACGSAGDWNSFEVEFVDCLTK